MRGSPWGPMEGEWGPMEGEWGPMGRDQVDHARLALDELARPRPATQMRALLVLATHVVAAKTLNDLPLLALDDATHGYPPAAAKFGIEDEADSNVAFAPNAAEADSGGGGGITPSVIAAMRLCSRANAPSIVWA